MTIFSLIAYIVTTALYGLLISRAMMLSDGSVASCSFVICESSALVGLLMAIRRRELGVTLHEVRRRLGPFLVLILIGLALPVLPLYAIGGEEHSGSLAAAISAQEHGGSRATAVLTLTVLAGAL